MHAEILSIFASARENAKGKYLREHKCNIAMTYFEAGGSVRPILCWRAAWQLYGENVKINI